MENPIIQLVSRCNKLKGRYGPGNNPVSCTAYRTDYENLGIFDAVERNGTAFSPKQCLYRKVAEGMEIPNMQSVSRCNKRTGRYGPGNNPVSCTAYRADYANLGSFDAVERNGTAFAPKQCSYRKEAEGMENPKMQSVSRRNKRTVRYAPANNTVSCTAYMTSMQICEFLTLSKAMVLSLHQSNLYIKR